MNHASQAFDPRHGYDLASLHYDSWRWFRFWRLNEAPLVRNWLEALPSGLGLDAGCGIGAYLTEIAASGHRNVGIDLSKRMLLVHSERSHDIADSLVGSAQANVALLPFVGAAFDWVLCTRVLSHLPDVRPVLKEFSRVLRSGGELLLTDVHPEHPYTYVSIPTAASEVCIETYKHTIDELRNNILDARELRVVSLEEYRLSELTWKPPKTDFEKLYRHPDKPVFYLCRVTKR